MSFLVCPLFAVPAICDEHPEHYNIVLLAMHGVKMQIQYTALVILRKMNIVSLKISTKTQTAMSCLTASQGTGHTAVNSFCTCL